MKTVIITGAAGLIGAEAVRFFSAQGFQVIGIDNDMRRNFFGAEASTRWQRDQLLANCRNYQHLDLDIRDRSAIEALFARHHRQISLVIHAAAQPSHDWAARDPHTDFGVNALGTLTMLEAVRQHCPDAVFIFTSTNKVYGDLPNRLPLVEQATRWEPEPGHPFACHGFDETLGLDQTTHSLFGVSKTAADLLVQEYGRYFGIPTAVFRGGCLTGPGHSGTELHGFLAYLMKCAVLGEPYTVFGYQGKQVRDNIHARDLISMFWQFYQAPRCGEVYNAGGSRHSHCSMREAIALCEEICDRQLNWTYTENHRTGDHIWYVSDVRKFQAHYPAWRYGYTLRDILGEIHQAVRQRYRR